MASNDQWPTVTSASSLGRGQGGKNKHNNGSNNRGAQNHQQMVLGIVKEMFESTLDYDVIISIAENCNWDLQSTIDALIALSATVDDSNKSINYNTPSPMTQFNKQNNGRFQSTPNDFLKMDKSELKQQLEGFSKYEQRRKNKKSKDSYQKNLITFESDELNTASSNINERTQMQNVHGCSTADGVNKDGKHILADDNGNPNVFSKNTPKQGKSPIKKSVVYCADFKDTTVQSSQDTLKPHKLPLNDKKFCGLKVHYRQSGTESSSDDDDADVVVEVELNDYNSRSTIPINVSQFLSSSISSSSQNIKAEVKTTKSPPQSPCKTDSDAQLESIKAAIQRNDKILILLRGLPGSGKSNFAKNLIMSTIGKNYSLYIFSADDYFKSSKGTYHYDFTKLSDAHNTCQNRVLQALKDGRRPIIIDNTNLQSWEMKPYAAMAVNNLYIVEVIDIKTPWALNANELTKKNTHGVPKDKIRRMLDRYEQGIDGTKLLEMFSLRYPRDSMPRRINRRMPMNSKQNTKEKIEKNNTLSPEDMETLQKIEYLPEMVSSQDKHPENNFKDLMDGKNIYEDFLNNFVTSGNTNDEKNKDEQVPTNAKSKCDDNYLLQSLGAIGCERKNSLVNLDTANSTKSTCKLDCDSQENNLSQCWDFTLHLEGETLHSDHANDLIDFKQSTESPLNTEDMRKQHKEFGKENNTIEEDPTLPNEGCLNDENERMEEFFRRLTQEYNQNGSNFVVKESTVIITEIFDDEFISTDAQSKIQESELDQTNKFTEINVDSGNYNDCVPTETAAEKNEDNDDITSDVDIEIVLPDKEESADVEIDSNECNSDKIIPQVEDSEAKLLINEQDASNLKETTLEESEKNILKEVKEKPAPKSTLGSLLNTIKISILGESKIIDKKEEEINQSTNEKNQNTSSKSEDISVNVENNLKSDIGLLSIENETIASEVFPDIDSAKTVEERLLDIEQSEKSAGLSGDNEKEDEKIDNTNRITWKESSFPLADVSVPTMISNNVLKGSNKKKLVSTEDNSTNTSYYDFNVAYVGGINAESGYRTIDAFNRSINDGLPLIKCECPPMKLMLEKSSMTGDIFDSSNNDNEDNNLDTENKTDRLPELIDLFPHIPPDYLIEIYINLCRKNFSWAVDVLLDGVPDDVVLKIPQKNEEGLPDDGLEIINEFEASSFDLMKHDSNNLQNSTENLLDINDDNEEIDFNNVCNVKNIKTDASNDTCSNTSRSTPSTSHADSPAEDKNSDEVIELNLGFDMIHELENKFGIPGFHIPDGFKPAIKLKKSLAEELYAMWIESMYQQMNKRHEQLDEMLKKDAEFAKNLERELKNNDDNEINNTSASQVPNLNEIMDMELALSTYRKEIEDIAAHDMPNDMASKLSRQKLHESLPDIDPETLNDILKAHNGNFKATFDTIQLSIGRPITSCDAFNKCDSSTEKLKEENENFEEVKYQRSRSVTPIVVVKPDSKSEKLLYRDTLLITKNCRDEAQRQFSLRMESLNKAADAYRRGYPQVAVYYSQVARVHAKNGESAHADAANALLEAQTLSNNDDILDLHYLFVSEALRVLDDFFEFHYTKLTSSNKRSIILYIITGRGARSNNGTSKIKPAVTKKLQSLNIRFQEINPGCLKVTLNRRN